MIGSYIRLRHNELTFVRKRMMLGEGLASIADRMGVTPLDLDLQLWARLGKTRKAA